MLADDQELGVEAIVRVAGNCGRGEEHLHPQVLLAERAEGYAAASEGAWRRAVAHVAELSRLPFAQRHQRAKEHAMSRWAQAAAPTNDPADHSERSPTPDPTSGLQS